MIKQLIQQKPVEREIKFKKSKESSRRQRRVIVLGEGRRINIYCRLSELAFVGVSVMRGSFPIVVVFFF